MFSPLFFFKVLMFLKIKLFFLTLPQFTFISLESSLYFWYKYYKNDILFYSAHHIRRYMLPIYVLIGKVSIDHSLNVEFSRFLHCKSNLLHHYYYFKIYSNNLYSIVRSDICLCSEEPSSFAFLTLTKKKHLHCVDGL